MGGDVSYEIMTTRFIGRDKTVTGLETVKVRWVDGRPEPIPGSEQTWKCDLVLLAMGYLGPRSELLKQIGCETDMRSNIKTDAKTRMSSVDGVFAAPGCIVQRGAALVREEKTVLQPTHRVLGGKRLLLEDVEPCTFYRPVLQG